MKVTLIRHTNVAVPKGTCYGWSDVDVADTFEEEAIGTLRLIEGCHFDHAFTSPLLRARKLAARCGYPDATPDDRLKEMNMGEWEMQPWDDIHDEALQRWFDDYMHLPATGGESFPMLYARVASFLDDLRHQPFDHVAVFAHGGVIVAAGIYAGLWDEKDAFAHQPPYGGVVELFF